MAFITVINWDPDDIIQSVFFFFNSSRRQKICSILEPRKSRGFTGSPVTKTPCSQCRGPGFKPWSGNEIPHAATKSLHAETKDTAWCNED